MSDSEVIAFRWEPQAKAILAELAESEGIPRGEVIRRALERYRWMVRERHAGTKLLVQRGGDIREVVFYGDEDVDA